MILSAIEPHFNSATSKAIQIKHKLAATLRFLAEGSYQHGVGQDFNSPVCQSTFSKLFDETLKIMESTLCPQWISIEMNEQEQQEARMYFYRKSSIPGIIGCVDGTHIKIIAPKNDKDLHYNRKGFYSLNVLMVCRKRYGYYLASYCSS